jgi:hypothetical protein
MIVVVARLGGLHLHDERRAAWPRLGVSMRP